MSKKKKEDDALRAFLISEVYKAFNKHPNRTFNYKQLVRTIKLEVEGFVAKHPDAIIDIEKLNGGLKKEIQKEDTKG